MYKKRDIIYLYVVSAYFGMPNTVIRQLFKSWEKKWLKRRVLQEFLIKNAADQR